MKIITDKDIRALNISPARCVDWVRESFLMKDRSTLPPKISLHPRGDDFINTMPCLLPEEYGMYGCKIVSRIRGSVPSLKSKMLMVDSTTGDDLALIDADWITAMRTGAVAALAVGAGGKGKGHAQGQQQGRQLFPCFHVHSSPSKVFAYGSRSSSGCWMQYTSYAKKTQGNFGNPPAFRWFCCVLCE